MDKEYHRVQELTMSDLGLCLEELSEQPLELFAREGAKLVLTVALEEEVMEYLQRGRYERSQGNQRLVSNSPKLTLSSNNPSFTRSPADRMEEVTLFPLT